MKSSKFLAGVALCASTAIFLVSCQKDYSFDKSGTENTRLSGAVKDDPAAVAKVPMIVSANFLQLMADDPINQFNAKGDASGGGGKADRTAPVVSINAPLNSAAVSGAISVQITASDNVGVTMVKFSVNGTSIANTATSPYSFLWNTASVPNGSHTLTATAFDAAGNSKAVSIQVTTNNTTGGDVISPTVSISSPTNGSSVSGTVNIQANASDNEGVSSVKFIINGIVAGTDNTAPYSYSWNTAGLANGIHTITATATDAAGNAGSNTIQVTINTTVIPPTTLPSSVNLLMPPVGYQGGEGSCVAFSIGYYAKSAEQYYKTNASSYSYANNIFSPEFLYNQTKFGDCGSGTAIITALEFLKNTGICTWQSMPYSYTNGCSLMPSSSQLNEAAIHKISAYSAVYKSDITAIKNLLYNKHPLIIMVVLDQSFPNAQPGFIWRSYSGNGGFSHSLTICGYDDAKQAFKVVSSWGTNWGDEGYSWIDYNFLAQTGDVGAYVIN